MSELLSLIVDSVHSEWRHVSCAIRAMTFA